MKYAAFSMAVLLAVPAAAQVPTDAFERPSERRFEPDELIPREQQDLRLQLPPIPPVTEDAPLAAGPRVRVERFNVAGSTVFSPDELSVVTAPFEGREVSVQELSQVRNAITRMYIDAGYATSGATLPDQSVRDGIVDIHVTEGELQTLQIEGYERFQRRYLASRIEGAAEPPLNVWRIEEELQMLLRDDRISRVAAELFPGERRGLSVLSIGIEEARPWTLRSFVSNQRTPAVGSEGGGLFLEHRNLTGNGDTFSILGEMTEGFADLEARYSIPLNRWDTRLSLRFRQTASEIEESPFDDLEIESDAVTYSATLEHPIIRRLDQGLWLGLTAEHRRSDTEYIFGSFPFIPGSDDGEVKLTIARVFQEWTQRSGSRVIAARSTFNFGTGALRATTNSGDVPSGRFFSWLAQLQVAQRLPAAWRNALLIFRTELQLTPDPLFGQEPFAVGGVFTVRGYRENELVRDNGWVSSVELRIPVLRDAKGSDVLQVAPFFDIGKAWNEGDRSGPNTLASLGLGLRYRPIERLLLQMYWGGRLRSVSRRGNDIQNNGFHFRGEFEY
jgi:hemolysin activation/secretion protein